MKVHTDLMQNPCKTPQNGMSNSTSQKRSPGGSQGRLLKRLGVGIALPAGPALAAGVTLLLANSPSPLVIATTEVARKVGPFFHHKKIGLSVARPLIERSNTESVSHTDTDSPVARVTGGAVHAGPVSPFGREFCSDWLLASSSNC